MPYPIAAQPPLEFIPPAFDPIVLRATQLLLPTWVRFKTDLARVEATNVETLVKLYDQFQHGKVRLLLAFRHPSVDDPFCLASLIWQILPKAARQQGVSLKSPVHAHFIYDRGIPLWAGSYVGWLYSRLGGTPIMRGKLDRAGLRSVRDLLANGKLPLAAAPEGATNGHGEIVSPLEPGVAQMGFWCVEDLVKAGRTEQVLIVPIGIQYRFITPPWEAIDRLLSEMEQACGLSPKPQASASLEEAEKAYYDRLLRLGEHLLSLMESFYTRFYNQTLTPASNSPVTSNITESNAAPSAENRDFAVRLQVLLDAALKVAEQYFNVPSKGTVTDRCRRLEQAGWDRIYREDLKQIESLSSIERGLADRIAEESDLRMWHMRLVESFVAVTGRYVREKPTVERFAETTLLMWDVVARIKGGNPFQRPRLGKRSAHVTIGTPLSVSDRWETYQTDRRSAKQSVTDLTQELQSTLQNMIV